LSKGGDKNDIIELTYNDWVKGKIPGIVEHGVKRGLNTYIDSASRERKYFKITDEEFDKINKKQKEIYDRLVNNQFKITNNAFEEKFDRSSNKERVLGKEIEYFQFLFFPEKEDFKYPMPHTNRTINNHYLSLVRALYIKLIENDKRDYSHIKYVDEKKSDLTNSDSEEKRLKEDIHVEAITKHLEWLGGLQNPKSTHPDDIISETDWDKIIKIGIGAGFWDQDNNIILKRNSLYSSGKTFLGLLFQVLKKYGFPHDYTPVIPEYTPIEKGAEFFLNEFKRQNKTRKDAKHQYREFREIVKKDNYDRIVNVFKRGGLRLPLKSGFN